MKKYLIRILILLPIVAIAFYIFIIKPGSTQADWLNPSWGYRKSITLTRASGQVSGYQMKILVGESSGSGTNDVNCDGHCKTDFSDLRFTASDGTTTLPYWIETPVSGTTPNQVATVWVKFDTINTTATTFYMYYGNSGASAQYATPLLAGTATFTLFDDFEDASLDTTTRWTSGGGTPTESGGVLTVDSSAEYVYSKSTYGVNTSLRYRANHPNVESNWIGFIVGGGSPLALFERYPTGMWTGRSYVSSSTDTSLDNAFLGGNQIYEITRDNGTSNLYSVNNSLKGTHTTNVTSSSLPVTMYMSATATMTVDWILVRQYLNPEPAWGTWGSEDPQPTATPTPTSTPWYSSSWGYRKQIGIANAGSLLNLYQMKLTILRGNSRLIGATASSGTANNGGNYVQYWKFTADYSGAVNTIRMYSRVNGNIKVALYSDSSGSPGTKLTDNSAGVACTASQWNSVTVPSYTIAAGTIYWLAFNSSADGVGSYNSGGSGTVKYKAMTYEGYTFPSTAESGFTDGSSLDEMIQAYGLASDSGSRVSIPDTEVRSDYNDIRFAKSDGTSTLDYWIESSDSASATVWIEFDPISASATTNFYMYYGNAVASTASNGANTFGAGKFDNFEWGSNTDPITNNGGNVDWALGTGNADISTAQKYTGIASETQSMGLVNDAAFTNPNFSVTAPHSGMADYALRVRWYKENATNNAFLALHGNGSYEIYVYHTGTEKLRIFDTGEVDIADVSHSEWHLLEIKNINWNAHTYDVYVDEAFVRSNAMYSTSDDNDIWKFGLSANPGGNAWFDNVIVRKWTTTEPTWGTWGSEEAVPVPTSTPTPTTAPTATPTPIPWYNSSWGYRKSVTITNAVASYQTKILVGESSGSGTNDVHCNGHVLSNFNDLRFTASDGVTLLPYWIETPVVSGTSPNQVVAVWVKNNATPSTTGYMYYGNAAAPPGNSGTDTFELFDHFDDASLDTAKWDTVVLGGSSSATEPSGTSLDMYANAAATTWAGAGVVAKNALTAGNYAAEGYIERVYASNAGEVGLFIGFTDKSSRDTTYYGNYNRRATAHIYDYTSLGYYYILTSFDNQIVYAGSGTANNTGVWVRATLKMDNTAKKSYGTYVYSSNTYQIDTSTAGTTALSAIYPMIHYGEANSNQHSYADWIAIRKWTTTEPTWETWGAEDAVPTPTPTPAPAINFEKVDMQGVNIN